MPCRPCYEHCFLTDAELVPVYSFCLCRITITLDSTPGVNLSSNRYLFVCVLYYAVLQWYF